jgi:hypothetical protein
MALSVTLSDETSVNKNGYTLLIPHSVTQDSYRYVFKNLAENPDRQSQYIAVTALARHFPCLFSTAKRNAAFVGKNLKYRNLLTLAEYPMVYVRGALLPWYISLRNTIN